MMNLFFLLRILIKISGCWFLLEIGWICEIIFSLRFFSLFFVLFMDYRDLKFRGDKRLSFR